MTTPYTRKLGQGFIGIGVRGRTVIMLPVWSSGGPRESLLRLCLIAGSEAEPEILGRTTYLRSCEFATYAVLADGSSVWLGHASCVTDAAMDIFQYHADAGDPRMHLDFFEAELNREEDRGSHHGGLLGEPCTATQRGRMGGSGSCRICARVGSGGR